MRKHETPDKKAELSSAPLSVPLELLYGPPRSVGLAAAGKAAAVIAVVLLIVGWLSGVLLYLAAAHGLDRLHRIRAEGAPTNGLVVGIGRTQGEHPKRLVRYRYDAGGRSREGSTALRDDDSRRFSAGTPLDVSYLPSEPEFSWLPGYEPEGVPIWAVPLTVLSCLAAPVIIAFSLRRQRRLLEEGRAALATVTESKHHDKGYRVRYEFKTLAGALRAGSYDLARKAPPVGSRVLILYHPDEPKLKAAYPLPLVRVRRP